MWKNNVVSCTQEKTNFTFKSGQVIYKSNGWGGNTH